MKDVIMNKKNNLFKMFESLMARFGNNSELPFQEKSNLAEWLESRLHLALTNFADDMFGSGTVTRNERKILSAAIGAALDAYHNLLVEQAPQLFERRPWEDALEDNSSDVQETLTPTSPPAPLLKERGVDEVEFTESGTSSMFVPLMEKAVRKDGTIPIKIIQPGWGSSGYYEPEVLERDGPKIFPKGTKMFWNHQTPAEEAERPEGDLNNLAAELISDARYQANGVAGSGLYADAKVFENYKSAVDDLAKHIGVSIRAYGKAVHGEKEGREGAIIQELTKGKSIDFVTAPGAGGQILSLFEAARIVHADKKKTTSESVALNEEVRMDEKEFKALQESVTTLQTNLSAVTDDNARLKETLALRDAKDTVREALHGLDLPDVTKARLLESLPKSAPMKDGVLDVEAFKTLISETVKNEVSYLTKAAGLGKIRGLGEAETPDEEDEGEVDEALAEAFSDLGLSEAGAKIAAIGRR